MVDQAMGTRRFHHVGLRAMDPQPDENFVTATRRLGNRPEHTTRNGSNICGTSRIAISTIEFKDTPHVAWVVDDIEPWIAGKEIAICPVRGRRSAVRAGGLRLGRGHDLRVHGLQTGRGLVRSE